MWPTAKTFDWYAEQRRSLAGGVRRLVNLIVANRKLAAAVAIGVFAVLAVITGYFALSSRREANAAAALFKAANDLAWNTGNAEEDTKKQEEGVRGLRELMARYPQTAAAAEATLRLGTLYYTLGNYDEARSVYESYLTKNPRGTIAFSAGMGVADTHLAQRKYEKAVETYSRLIDHFPEEPLLPQAYLNLARAYLDMKKEADATRLYGKVAETYPNTGWAQYAQSQLRKLIRR